MYTKFYNFKEKPFTVTPDARFFYPSRTHEDALNSLYYAVTEKRGFAVLTGNIGVGKTTVWRALIKKLGTSTKIAIITNTHLTSKQLIMSMMEEVNMEYQSLHKSQMLSRINKYLIDQFSDNNTVLLIVDEAQNLSPSVLEEIRMFSNLETEREKLLQILLIGQTEFKEKLLQKELSQLRQRITVAVHLESLTKDEMEGYIRFRIEKVSNNGNSDLFSKSAMEKVYEYSTGIPRLINSICDGALLVGFANGSNTITDTMVSEAVEDFLSFACLTNK